MAHCACNEKLWREWNVWCFQIYYLVTLTNDPDNINLSSPYHYPSGKNNTLLSGSHWPPKKKNYMFHYWSPGISTQVYWFKEALPLTLTVRTSVQSPQESVGFLPRTSSLTHTTSHTEWATTSTPAMISKFPCSTTHAGHPKMRHCDGANHQHTASDTR
jgi:hypothetical protein